MTARPPVHPAPPLVLHIPHAAAWIPPEWRGALTLSDAALRLEVLRITDWHTDTLFALPDHEARAVAYPVSRLVLDPERQVDDDVEPMAARGMGVIYTHTTDGQPLRRAPGVEERAALVERLYRPHHAALTAAVDGALAAHDRCLLVDCHSFPSRPLPCDLDQAPYRPAICLGTDPYHTPPELLEAARAACEAEGWDVQVDRPYAGVLVPVRFNGHDPRVRALMIEVNRGLYLDEATGAPAPGFAHVAAAIQRVLRRIAAIG